MIGMIPHSVTAAKPTSLSVTPCEVFQNKMEPLVSPKFSTDRPHPERPRPPPNDDQQDPPLDDLDVPSIVLLRELVVL